MVSCPRTKSESCSRSTAARSRSRTRARSCSPDRATPSSTSSATTSRWRRARCAPPAAGPTCWCATRTASRASSSTRSARRSRGPEWIEVVALSLPVRAHRRGGGAARRRRAGLDGEPRLPRAPSASGARRGSRSSRRAARRPRSGAGRRVAADARGRARGAGDARRLRTGRLAQDLGLARHPRQRAHRAALDLRSGAARRAGAGARGRAARARHRHQQVVEGGAPGRLHRLQPEREGPHRRRRLLGAAEARRASVGAARLERDRRLRPGRLHAARPCRRASPRSAIATPRSTIIPARSRACSSSRRATSARARATRRGRRSTRSSPASRRACSRRGGARTQRRGSRRREAEVDAPARRPRPPRAQAPADRDRALDRARTTRSPASSAGRGVTPKRPRISSPPTCWSTRCAADRRTWTRIRVNLEHVPESLRPPQEPLDPDDAPEGFERGPGGRFRWSAAQMREWRKRSQRAGRTFLAMKYRRGRSSTLTSNVQCPTCGRENAEDAAFCAGCGTRLARTCAGCGRALGARRALLQRLRRAGPGGTGASPRRATTRR